jgi:hypothetical protein
MRSSVIALGLVLAGCFPQGGDDDSVGLPCEPAGEVVATAGELDDTALAARAGSIYWVDKSDAAVPVLRRLDAAGAVHSLYGFAGAVAPSDDSWLAVDDTHVYWLGYGALVRVPIDGGPAEELASVERGTSLALDDTHAWFVRAETDAGAVVRVPKAGGPAVDVVWFSIDLRAVAVDDELVYVSRVDTGRDGAAEVYATNKDGPPMSTRRAYVAEPYTFMTQLAVDDTWVYASGAGTVRRWPLDFGDPEVVGRNISESFSISFAVADGDVFWSDRAGWLDADDDSQGPFTCGGIYRTSQSAFQLVAAGQQQPSTVVVDGNSLIWLALGNGGDGAVMRMAR